MKKTKKHAPPKLTNIRMPLKPHDSRLSEEKRYLAKIDGRWECGYFNKQWYGWLFHYGWTSSQISYDGGLTMHKRWQKLYEIE